MITGFNTDIDYEGRVYHVQTEDKGLANPVVESLIYCGGEIVTSRRSSYEELAESKDVSEEAVLQRMEAQHQALIRDIKNGKFDPDGHKPLGHSIISNRSFDEVVTDFLAENVQIEAIKLQLLDWQVLIEGTRPTVRMKVFKESTKKAVADARVAIELLCVGEQPKELFSAITDSEGFLEASFEIPQPVGPAAEIRCVAVDGESVADFKQPVRQGRSAGTA